MTRPRKGAPVWASDETFPDTPGKVWALADSKSQPSDGKIAAGFLPEEKPSVRFMNWWMNAVGLFCSNYLDGIDAKNWSAGVSSLEANAATTPSAIAWCEDQQLLFAVGRNNTPVAVIWSSENGTFWTINTIPSLGIGVALYDVLVYGSGILAIGYTPLKLVKRLGAGSWTDIDLSGLSDLGAGYHGAVLADFGDAAAKFVVGAEYTSGSNNGSIICLTSILGSPTRVVLTAPTGYTSSADRVPDHFVVGSDRVLAFCTGRYSGGIGAAHLGYYYSTDGVTWSAPMSFDGSNGAVALSSILDAWYDSTSELFWIWTTSGNKLYYSADGITWTLKSTQLTSIVVQSVAVSGSIWTAVDAVANRIMWTADDGDTWHKVPDPFENLTVGSLKYTRRVGDRFCAVTKANGTGDNEYISYSLRTL